MPLTKEQTEEKRAIKAFLEAFWNNPDGVMGELNPKSGASQRQAVEKFAEKFGIAALGQSVDENGIVDLHCLNVNVFVLAFVLGREFQKRRAMEESFK